MFLNIRVLQTTLVNAYIYFSVDKSIKKPKLYKYNNNVLNIVFLLCVYFYKFVCILRLCRSKNSSKSTPLLHLCKLL